MNLERCASISMICCPLIENPYYCWELHSDSRHLDVLEALHPYEDVICPLFTESQPYQIYILDLRRALEVIDSGRPLTEIANSNMKERSRDQEPAAAPAPAPEPEPKQEPEPEVNLRLGEDFVTAIIYK